MFNAIQREEVGESFSYFSETDQSNSSKGSSSFSSSNDNSKYWRSSSAPKKEEVGTSFTYDEPANKEEVGESFSYTEPSNSDKNEAYNDSSSYFSKGSKQHTYTHIPSSTYSTHYVFSKPSSSYYYPKATYYTANPRPVTLGGLIFTGAVICLGVLAISMILKSQSKGSSNSGPTVGKTPPPPRGWNPPPPPAQHTVDSFTKPIRKDCQVIRDTLLNCPSMRRVIHGVNQVYGKVCKMFKYPAKGSTPCLIKEEECRCDWRAVKA